jgi:hypothetical protein
MECRIGRLLARLRADRNLQRVLEAGAGWAAQADPAIAPDGTEGDGAEVQHAGTLHSLQAAWSAILALHRP